MNRKKLYLRTLCSALTLSFFMMACGDEEVTIKTQEPVEEEQTPPVTNPTVTAEEDRYVYLAVNENINGVWVPRIYSPGASPSEMTDGKKDAQIETIHMDSQRNLYASGWQTNSHRQMYAVYWKNCSVVLLTDSSLNTFSVATDVTTSGDDVYVSGYLVKDKYSIAAYWKNNQLVELTDGSTPAHTSSIFVSGDDVYVTGTEKNSQGKDEARLWKNGVKEKLNGTYASSVFVNEGDVYVAGDFGKGKYWKDGSYVSLGDTPGEGTIAVRVFNGSVYTLSPGKYWKDGSAFDLTKVSNTPALYSFMIFKDDVYIGGYAHKGDKLVACYWKNGEQIDVTDGTNNGAVSSIVVVGF